MPWPMRVCLSTPTNSQGTRRIWKPRSSSSLFLQPLSCQQEASWSRRSWNWLGRCWCRKGDPSGQLWWPHLCHQRERGGRSFFPLRQADFDRWWVHLYVYSCVCSHFGHSVGHSCHQLSSISILMPATSILLWWKLTHCSFCQSCLCSQEGSLLKIIPTYFWHTGKSCLSWLKHDFYQEKRFFC